MVSVNTTRVLITHTQTGSNSQYTVTKLRHQFVAIATIICRNHAETIFIQPIILSKFYSQNCEKLVIKQGSRENLYLRVQTFSLLTIEDVSSDSKSQYKRDKIITISILKFISKKRVVCRNTWYSYSEKFPKKLEIPTGSVCLVGVTAVFKMADVRWKITQNLWERYTTRSFPFEIP